jgi:hypothetical protein
VKGRKVLDSLQVGAARRPATLRDLVALGGATAEVIAHDIYRPDVSGWRRDRVPQRPLGRPISVRPDVSRIDYVEPRGTERGCPHAFGDDEQANARLVPCLKSNNPSACYF